MHWGEAESPSGTTRLHWTRCHTGPQCRNQAVDYAVVVGVDCGIIVENVVAVVVVGAVADKNDEGACGFAV